MQAAGGKWRVKIAVAGVMLVALLAASCRTSDCSPPALRSPAATPVDGVTPLALRFPGRATPGSEDYRTLIPPSRTVSVPNPAPDSTYGCPSGPCPRSLQYAVGGCT